MEELRRLEQVQRTLAFMQPRGFLSNNQDSDRFLANFILLLVQPCGELNFDNKCRLILQHLPSLSPSLLEEASLWLSEASQQNCIPSDILKESECDLLASHYDDRAMVGLDAMQRANSTLEDFCRSYLMFHGMDAGSPQAIFKYLPVLSFTESYIYQLDTLNEKILDVPTNGITGGAEEIYHKQVPNLTDVFKAVPFKPLIGMLEHHGLLTERIREELRFGEEYWALERKLCWALMSRKQVSIENVMRAIHLKSFDYRVLNLLLYQLRGEKVNDLHMEFLSISEFLVEISDDLFDYEVSSLIDKDDVLENNFNILRMFVRIYGPSTGPTMLAKCISKAEEKYQALLKSLDLELSINYQRRCEEAAKEGGMISGHPFGTWTIPPIIADEESYRSNSSLK
ncbi:uncharacterized protein LOC123199388 isoform X2 [Mangifera indica]|uniref:uncharacterized protein LOC123199388 isoform X2 n=1 Tax=Mangifera indica TaxID=29780 RepID=UPI001CFABCE6|nr:uncharacterized protein LOC123199388 isoform X2 [Mangifera indica]